MTQITSEELRIRMFYQKPDGDAAAKHMQLQQAALDYAKIILDVTEPSREQALAITKLEEAKMWSNAAIAHAGAKKNG